MSEPICQRHYAGDERQETDEAKAERILADELRRRWWSREDLAHWPRRDDDDAKLNCAAIVDGSAQFGQLPASRLEGPATYDCVGLTPLRALSGKAGRRFARPILLGCMVN